MDEMYNDKFDNAGSKEVMNFANSWTIMIDIQTEKNLVLNVAWSAAVLAMKFVLEIKID